MENEIVHIKTDNILDDARKIIETARSNAVRSVDFSRVQMYWNLGRRIFEDEQEGKDRADYGTYLIKNLAKNLEAEYGSGFGVRQLEQSRQFYRTYPIANTLRSQLNWSQYRALIQISDKEKREYYELESMNNGWTARETERQINSYDRNEKLDDENPTIGILLCTAKNDEMVKMTLPKDNKTILASKYELYLPSKEALQEELEKLSEAQQKFDEANNNGADK